MSEMVERVARALARNYGAKITGPSRHRASDEIAWDPSHNYMREYVDRHWKEHEQAARWAIEAMQEPTPEMLVAGGDGWVAEGDIWRAMIDAAIK